MQLTTKLTKNTKIDSPDTNGPYHYPSLTLAPDHTTTDMLGWSHRQYDLWDQGQLNATHDSSDLYLW